METIQTQMVWNRVGQTVGQAWQSSKTKIANIYFNLKTIKITPSSLKTRAAEFGGKAVNLLLPVVKNHPVVTISLVIAGGISALYLLNKCTKNKMQLLEAENQKLQKQIQDNLHQIRDNQKQIQDDKFNLIGTKNILCGKDEELRNTSALLQKTQIMLQRTKHQLAETQNILNEVLQSQSGNQVNAHNDIQSQNDIEQPVKRGRGRPRKIQNKNNLQLENSQYSMVTRSKTKKSSTESECLSVTCLK